jgi:uncharacterized membrane protein YfhO
LGVRVEGLWRNLSMICKQPYYEGYNSFQFCSFQQYESSPFFHAGVNHKLVYLSDEEGALSKGDTVTNICIGTNEITAAVLLNEKGRITLLQNYHKNWKVFVDGKDRSKELFETNYTLPGLVIEGGRHTVRYQYDPVLSCLAFIFSVISFVLMLGISLFLQRNSKVSNDFPST